MPSSVIAHFDYIPGKKALRVKFLSGNVYEYQKVPLEVYEGMCKAFSKGTFLNENIKGHYRFKKIE